VRKAGLLEDLEICRDYYAHFMALNEQAISLNADDPILVRLREIEDDLRCMSPHHLTATLDEIMESLDAEAREMGLWNDIELRLLLSGRIQDVLRQSIEATVEYAYFAGCEADAVLGRGLNRLASELDAYGRLIHALPDDRELSREEVRSLDERAKTVLAIIWCLKYSVSGKSESFYFQRRPTHIDILSIFGGSSFFNGHVA